MPVLLILLLVIFGSLTAALLPLAIGGTAHPRLVRRAAAADPGHRRVHLLDQHHHDPGPGPGHRLRPVHGGPVPRGAAGGSRRSRPRSRGPSPPRAGPSPSPGSRSRWPCPASCCSPRCSCGRWATAASRPSLVDMLAALTLLPALLALLGPPGERAAGAPPGPRGRCRPRPGGAWRRIAGSVMRRPVLYVVVIVAALLALGTPFLSVKWGGTDARVLPASSQPQRSPTR